MRKAVESYLRMFYHPPAVNLIEFWDVIGLPVSRKGKFWDDHRDQALAVLCSYGYRLERIPGTCVLTAIK